MLAAFILGMAGVVYMSLSGSEVIVPEIIGKDFVESEKTLAQLGLKIKRRAERPSAEKINTVLEQLPKAGETVKTGQLILVVVSKAGLENEEKPDSLIKDIDSDDSKKIEEMISEKPKKLRSNSNANAKKKADTTRDVNANETGDATETEDESKPKPENSNKPSSATPSTKRNSNAAAVPTLKPQSTPSRPAETRPKPPSKP